MAKIKQDFPAGWDEARVQRVIEEYKAEIVGEPDGRRYTRANDYAFVEVPKDLVPVIRKLVAEYEKKQASE